MEIVANSDVKVEVKPVNFDDLPPAILKKLLNEDKKTANNDASGYEQFNIASKILSGRIYDSSLEEGFSWLYQSVQRNCPYAINYISNEVYRLETTQNLSLKDFKWVQNAVTYNFESAITMVRYYSTDLTRNPMLSLGIYLIGNNIVPQNIEVAVAILNNIIDNDNGYAFKLLQYLYKNPIEAKISDIKFFFALINFTGNKVIKKEYFDGIKLLTLSLNEDSINAKNYVNKLIENYNGGDLKESLLLGMIFSYTDNDTYKNVDSGRKILDEAYKNLKANYNEADLNMTYELALCYENAYGSSRNLTAAESMYKKLVAAGWNNYENKVEILQKLIEERRNKRISRCIKLIILILFTDILIFDCAYFSPISDLIRDIYYFIGDIIFDCSTLIYEYIDSI